MRCSTREAEADQAQLQQQVNALHTADLRLQDDEARCRLMAVSLSTTASLLK